MNSPQSDEQGVGLAEVTEVARSDHQVTGVTVSPGGRIFVNFLR
ncbi:hypothetical protein [Sphingomonas xinjiangensis]|uniref:Uncharacterized protein n=1 Tax=Sphingomonas xinjiangensis TaxID=643568 RepID=A0A840YRD0_9SPHN|nr:hypothetical protein [Sphingomonas xinjiangensis]MBB5711463.1 hypothetical protein [Sphingomonas xinjiangensis]